jgi:hypothetical protein
MCFEEYSPQYVRCDIETLTVQEISDEQDAIRAHVMKVPQDSNGEKDQVNMQDNPLKEAGTIFTIS